MSPNGKWLEGVAADADVAEAARKALGERLAAVLYWLPPAAYCADFDVEHIHRLRVSTRRAMAAWRLFRTWLPRKRAERVRKWLRKLRRTAGEARDLDVLHERIQHEYGDDASGVLAHIKMERIAVQPRIVHVADLARRRNRLANDVKRLVESIEDCCNKRSCDECAPFHRWSERRLHDLSEDFFKDLPNRDASLEDLHQFRIQSKQLRYALELLAPILADDLREVHYPVVEEIQDRLGAINDHATAAERFEEWAKVDKLAAIQGEFAALAQNERQRIETESCDFYEWWTTERAESLRAGLFSTSTPTRSRTVLA
jgi:CHAD domain-containing protein